MPMLNWTVQALWLNNTSELSGINPYFRGIDILVGWYIEIDFKCVGWHYKNHVKKMAFKSVKKELTV